MTVKEVHADLTIIGAGPTGLSLALLAQNLGLSVFIADKSATALQLGRADALNARTQQSLELMGVLDQLEPYGLKCNTSSTFANGEFISRQSHWWTGLKHCHRPNFLMIGQADIERALEAKLAIPVHRNSEATKIEEISIDGEDFVRTEFPNTVVISKYAVGADGSRSIVRSQLDIPFEGTKPNMIWHVLDTFLDTDFPVAPEIITFQVNGQARRSTCGSLNNLTLVDRERGMARFYVLFDDGQTRRPQSAVEEEIRKFLEPHRVDFRATEWFSTFEIKERVARTFFSPKRRIALAGDAAHVHAVNGGQGLNTGLADAFALAWRLNLATRGFPEVLESYETERRTSAVGIIDVAAKLVRSTVKTATEYVDLIERNAAYITGMGVNYEADTPVLQGAPAGIFVPGRRMPDVYFHEQSNSAGKRFYTIPSYGTFIVLSLGEVASWTPPADAAWARFVDSWRVSPAFSSEGQLGTGKSFARLSEDGGETAVDAGTAGYVVVRPDMYTGYAGEDPTGYFEGMFRGGFL
ncbi:putative monooxygenase [Phyllosticta citriasiana]|uniref:Monooxygenase n=1 Tax=Phyllosticta citriasiana TaxID=595635 RepID=A0ABR1L062_9PEZI